MQIQTRTLEEQKQEFKESKLIATPIAGLIAWICVFISSLFFSDFVTVWVLFIATGSIVYMGMGISKRTGENFLDKSKPVNTFNTLFLYTVAQAILVYSIAIPFFLQDYTSLPLTVGILTGLMWLPISWIIDHWIGVFHAMTRTSLIVLVWYLFPANRFTSISVIIILIYAITLVILNHRYKEIKKISAAHTRLA
jgi:hypothetical protein